MSRKYDVQLSDEQWALLEPLLPKPKNRGQGGRPRADDRACFEGILWVLRSGARWRDLPERFPSPSTCWRRLGEWEAEEVLDDIWRAFLDTLDVSTNRSPVRRKPLKSAGGSAWLVDFAG